MVPEDSSRIELNRVRQSFIQFLESEGPDAVYLQEQLEAMTAGGQRRLVVSVDHLRAEDAPLAARLLDEPVRFLAECEAALATMMLARLPNLAHEAVNKELKRFYLGFDGAFGTRRVSPRGLRAEWLGRMVCVEGIVTRVSAVRPKVIQSVHYVPATGQMKVRDYRDGITLDADASRWPTPALYPTKDDDGNPMETEFGLSSYRDYQSASLQEMPERTPAGQLPRTVDLVFEADLVDACKPGARVRAIGTYRAVGGKNSVHFGTKIVVNHVVLLNDTQSRIKYTERDLANIRHIAHTPGGTDLLAASLAPSICGHALIKKALLLLLLGGVEKNLPNAAAAFCVERGAAGDLHHRPRFIGRRPHGRCRGRCRHRRAPPGGGRMVLADRGIVCIDEFDKMSDADRVAIHEAMEQQTVTIAKAGIHTTLNARCSVIAAANPVYGAYDRRRKPADNIALPDSLLSRFDVLFIVLDTISRERDEQIAAHVLDVHRFRRGGDEGADAEMLDDPEDEADRAAQQRELAARAGSWDSDEEDDDDEAADAESAPVFVRQQVVSRAAGDASHRVLSVPFLQKFIQYAKRLRPTLTPEAAEYVAARYRDLRAKDDTRTLPITARQLETMIRLATAHAKSRLSLEVETLDACAAFDILNFALYNEARAERLRPATATLATAAARTPRRSDTAEQRTPARSSSARKRHRRPRQTASGDPYAFDDDGESETDSQATADDGDAALSRRARRLRMRRRPSGDTAAAESAAEEEMPEADEPPPVDEDRPSATEPPSTPIAPLLDRETAEAMLVARVRSAIESITATERRESATLEELIARLDDSTLALEDIERVLQQLEDAGQVLYRDRVIFRI
eukprot:ctg_368.g267